MNRYKPKSHGIGVADWIKDKFSVRPGTWRLAAAIFRILPTAARLSRYPVLGAAFKRALMLGPAGKRFTQGVALPLRVVIPVSADLTAKAEKVVVPIEMMKDAVRRSSCILALHRCICRDAHNCKTYSHQIACIFLGQAARITEKHGLGHMVTADEACTLIDRAADAGLVGQALWVEVEQYLWGFQNEKLENFLELCFCCPCCCTALNIVRNATADVRRLFHSSGWRAKVNDNCVLCGRCQAVCPQHAIDLGGVRAMVSKECIGCGLCSRECAADAIQMVLDEGRQQRLEQYFSGLNINITD